MSAETSKAVEFREFGPPEVLQYVEVPMPDPDPGEVRIQMRAASLNPIDYRIRNGWMEDMFPTEFPRVLGTDLSGVVVAVGQGADWKIGDEVVAFAENGTYRTHSIASKVFAKPSEVPWEVAAGVPAVGETAMRVLDALGLDRGQTFLIHGAAGGVGSVTAQLAIRDGINVVGTSSEANHDYLRSLDVTPVLYGDGLVERVRTVAPEGVDWALDCSGRDALPALIELAGSPERVMTIADADFPKFGVQFTGIPTHHHVVPDLLRLVAEGELVLPVDSKYSLAEASAAHAHSEKGHLRGKIVLVP